MQVPFLILVALGVALAKGPRAGIKYTTCYSEQNWGGYNHTFENYCPDLAIYNFGNDIDSVTVAGMWVYYENINYNSYSKGNVYWTHGIDFSFNFPFDYVNMCSSLKYIGSPECLNCDSWTVYEGTMFTGAEYYGTTDSTSIGSLDDEMSSIVITGSSPWTFYEGPNFTGYSMCLYPETDHDVGSNGETLDLGVYPDISTLGLYDDAINSVRLGCFSQNVTKAAPLKAQHRAENGAWGFFEQ